jgi:hypothetical protein
LLQINGLRAKFVFTKIAGLIISKNVSDSSPIPEKYAKIYKYGELLAKAYCKAIVELEICALSEDKSIINHHASLAGDLLDEMLELVEHFDPENVQSEFKLPVSHPHWLPMADEEENSFIAKK